MERAEDHIANNELDQALEWLELAWTECDRTNMRIAFKMGETYIKMGQLKKAIRVLKMCLKLSMAS